ncbi:MAG: hypothetical protein CM15mV93_070 [Caudoviricetes sp.]|nr:MAG: hypothetical protein CM15mV93_070 [Caudoviricetes sp.]
MEQDIWLSPPPDDYEHKKKWLLFRYHAGRMVLRRRTYSLASKIKTKQGKLNLPLKAKSLSLHL